MASFNLRLAVLALALAFCIQGSLGNVTCENLSKDSCAFAVSSDGKRCVLEQRMCRSGVEKYTCRSSEIEADATKDWIESDECIKACGLERNVLGISSDSLLESRFTQKLCSASCYNSCPNIVDLYFNLAAGEGVYLPKLCEAQKVNVRRGMSELKSSGIVAPGPVATGTFVEAPAPISTEFFVEAPVPAPISTEFFGEAPAPAMPPSFY